MPPDTVEEALPEAPSGSMPGRALEERDTGRGWGENTGRLTRRKPGLGQDRGSLKRPKGDTPTGSSPRPGSGAGRTPVDEREPTARSRAPRTSRPGSPDARSNPGMPGSELRGRPPGSLYADEASSPPGDPLMAALVSGEEKAAAEPPPVHPLYPHGMPSDSEFRAVDAVPPARPTLDDDSGGTTRGPAGPRVVPPSTGRRTSTIGGRRGGSVAGKRDPRGNRVASPPSAPGGILPDSPRPEAHETSTPTPLDRNTQPPGTGLSAGAAEIGPPSEDPLADLLPDLPLPPPPDLEKQFGRSRDDTRKTIRTVLIAVFVVVLLVAAHDSWRMLGHIGSLNAVLETGQATPALKRKLDAEVSRLGLTSSLERGWATIEGANDRFHIGVEVQHRIVGVPMTYEASKSGPFRVKSKLPTLEYFTDGGWQLDDPAKQALREYQASRRR